MPFPADFFIPRNRLSFANLTPRTQTYAIVDNQNFTVSFWFDSFLSFSLDESATVPTQPIERGGFSSDSKFKDPATFEIEAIRNANRLVIGALINRLREAEAGKYLFTIVTASKIYRNNVMSNLSYKVSDGARDTLRAEMTFSEVVLTSPESELVPAPSNPDSSSRVDLGQKSTSKSKSALVDLAG